MTIAMFSSGLVFQLRTTPQSGIDQDAGSSGPRTSAPRRLAIRTQAVRAAVIRETGRSNLHTPTTSCAPSTSSEGGGIRRRAARTRAFSSSRTTRRRCCSSDWSCQQTTSAGRSISACPEVREKGCRRTLQPSASSLSTPSGMPFRSCAGLTSAPDWPMPLIVRAVKCRCPFDSEKHSSARRRSVV